MERERDRDTDTEMEGKRERHSHTHTIIKKKLATKKETENNRDSVPFSLLSLEFPVCVSKKGLDLYDYRGHVIRFIRIP